MNMVTQVLEAVWSVVDQVRRERDEARLVVQELLDANMGVWSHSEEGRAYIARCMSALEGEG